MRSSVGWQLKFRPATIPRVTSFILDDDLGFDEHERYAILCDAKYNSDRVNFQLPQNTPQSPLCACHEHGREHRHRNQRSNPAPLDPRLRKPERLCGHHHQRWDERACKRLAYLRSRRELASGYRASSSPPPMATRSPWVEQIKQ